jgi:hypothetical protein
MSAPDDKVLLTTLWVKTSASGREYLFGYLGKAKLIAFKGKPAADGTATWDVFIKAGQDQEGK